MVSDFHVAPTSAGLDVTFPSGRSRFFTWRWLRDHDQSADAFNPDTAQRTVDTFAIDDQLSSTEVVLNDGVISIEWDGSPAITTTISTALLAAVTGETTQALRQPWNAASFGSGSTPDLSEVEFSFDALTADDEAAEKLVGAWLDTINNRGFAIVSGIPGDITATERLVRSIAPPLETIYGQMWTVESGSIDHADCAYSNDGLEPHTDGTYVHDAPGLQLLHFVQQAGDGGASVLVDGLHVVDELLGHDPDVVDTLSSVPVPAHYIEPGVELRATRPALRMDGTRLIQLSFNNYDRSPMWLEHEEMTAFYEAYAALHERVVDPANQLVVTLQPGQAVVFNNWRVLHGRTGFTGTRIFHGAYVARDRFDSRHRVLTHQAGR